MHRISLTSSPVGRGRPFGAVTLDSLMKQRSMHIKIQAVELATVTIQVSQKYSLHVVDIREKCFIFVPVTTRSWEGGWE